MKKIIFLALTLFSQFTFAALQDRCILVGDSIMSNVFEENSNTQALSRNLTAHLLEENLGEPLFKLVWNIPSYDLVIDPENQAIMENLPWEFAVHRASQI
jgi:hypothetical protein